MKSLLILVLLPVALLAQDTLYTRQGDTLPVSIREITEKSVLYTAIGGSSSWNISKAELIRVVWNGSVIEFSTNENRASSYAAERKEPIDFGHHFFAVNISDLARDMISFSYEYTFPSGSFSLRIPYSYLTVSHNVGEGNFSGNGDTYYGKGKTFSTGLDFYCYPFGQGVFRPFFGPSIEYGEFYNEIFYYEPSQNYAKKYDRRLGNYAALLVHLGVKVQPVKYVCLTLFVGFGGSKSKVTTNEGDNYIVQENQNQSEGRFGLLAGFKF